MTQMKLVALDEEDLSIVSAHVQDAVLKVADIVYRPAEKRLVIAMNRYAWEKPQGLFRASNERRRSVLHFDRVLAMRTTSIARDRPDDVLSLLAARFEATEAPAGVVELTFAGGAAIRLDVECIEARLTDLGAAWQATSRPRHRQ